jgi:hypothetical protein
LFAEVPEDTYSMAAKDPCFEIVRNRALQILQATRTAQLLFPNLVFIHFIYIHTANITCCFSTLFTNFELFIDLYNVIVVINIVYYFDEVFLMFVGLLKV